MPPQADTPKADEDQAAPPADGDDKKPCNTLPEVATERDNDIVDRIDVLIDHADIAGPDWIKDVLQKARGTIVDLRATVAARDAARRP